MIGDTKGKRKREKEKRKQEKREFIIRNNAQREGAEGLQQQQEKRKKGEKIHSDRDQALQLSPSLWHGRKVTGPAIGIGHLEEDSVRAVDG